MTKVNEEILPDAANFDDTQFLSRRKFLSDILRGAMVGCCAASLLDCLRGETTLVAEAAELAREVVTVDLHCHPSSLLCRRVVSP